MPATTFIPNVNAVIKLDNSGGVLTDVSDYVSTVTVDLTASIGKFFVFGEPGAQSAEGKRDVTDSTSASFRISGEFYLSAWQIFNQDAAGDGTPATQTASLQADGLPTYSVL
jgi:hypothetical protein